MMFEKGEKNCQYLQVIEWNCPGTSLVVQWLRLQLPMQGAGFNPWGGNYIPHVTIKSSHATTETQHSEINK